MDATTENNAQVTSDVAASLTFGTNQVDGVLAGSELDLSVFLPLWPTWLMIVTCFAIAFSIVGNFWVLAMGITTPAIRNSSFHLLLMNHSLANLGLSIMSYPYMTHRMRTMTAEGSSGELLGCRYWSVTVVWLVFVALISNAVIATNRAMACYPQYRLSSFIRSKNTTVSAILFMWVFHLFLFLLLAFVDEYGWNKLFLCMPIKEFLMVMFNPMLSGKGEGMRTIVTTIFAVIVIGALVVCLTSYSIIIHHLCTRPANVMSTAAARRRKDKKHALAVISLVFTIFIVCWIPTVVGHFYDSTIVSRTPILYILPTFESFFTPLVYMVTVPVFRPRMLCLRGPQVGPAAIKHTKPVKAVTAVKSSTQSTHSRPTRQQLVDGQSTSTQLTQVVAADVMAPRYVQKRAVGLILGRGFFERSGSHVTTGVDPGNMKDLAVTPETSTL